MPVETCTSIPIITSPGINIRPGPTPENDEEIAPIQENIIMNNIFFLVNFKSPYTNSYPHSTLSLYSFLITFRANSKNTKHIICSNKNKSQSKFSHL